MQALMLAAGMGKRLGRYTSENTKCMLKIHNKTLIERATEALLDNGINHFVIVIGYKGQNLKNYLLKECQNPRIKEMNYVFVENNVYDNTNNIYSLYLGKEELIKDDTILLESDLIYDYDLIKKLVESKEENLVSVAKYEQWMDGTVIKVDNNLNITEFIEKKDFNYNEINQYYKTVNIYKFSQKFSDNILLPFLDAYIKAYGKNEYYELVLKIIAHLSRSQLKALDVSDLKWYEIDDAQDLDIVNCLFSEGTEKLKNFQKRYGGYWRFESLLDFCYLVNPYFPSENMINKFNYFSKQLITQYPSGQAIECINASRLCNDIDESYLCVGNGAAELINSLGKIIKKDSKMYVSQSAFNEYVRCLKDCKINFFDMAKDDYRYNIQNISDSIDTNDIICLVNPDNPTGSFIEKEKMIQLIDKCQKLNKIMIFDESFIDFADESIRYSLIDEKILSKYPNLIVIKSISKSYGVPGIRLGILATGNFEIINKIKNEISIWNINSFGEYFLQIANLYKNDYILSCNKIVKERNRFIKELNKIEGLKVYNSEANYLLCYLEKKDSTELAAKLLNNNIFIKDLKTKKAFENKNFIRIAVRNEQDNNILIKNLKTLLK
jgi:histidinol-phosphate/aromatic aminotransferase/cobyric acid decarboxylase-like protein/choline kinase